MEKQEITCANCEAEFYIEHDQSKVEYCPFCGDQIIDDSEDLDYDVDV